LIKHKKLNVILFLTRNTNQDGNMKFAVFGLGHIGIPLTCIFASLGEVIGYDIDEKKVELINRGISPLPEEEIVPELLPKYVDDGRIKATTDLDYATENSDIKIIIVPLVLNENIPDFSIIENVSKAIGKSLKKEDLVIVSTTMPLGATRNVVGKTLEKESKLKMGEDFYLVYAPERTMNPHVIKDLTEKWNQIIGGVNQKSGEVARTIYEKVNKKGVIVVKNCETAEMIKLMEGVYRYVNIALANEIAKICEKNGIDFMEVMEKFNLIPYYNLHKATIGAGGKCIPIYPYFLLEHFEDPSLVQSSIKTNIGMPKHTIEIIKNKFGNLKEKKIAVLGLSFRGNIKDDSLSPTYELIKLLKDEEAVIFIHDPFFDKTELEDKTKATSIDLDEIQKMDGIIVATDHDIYKRVNFSGNIKFVFDGKSFLDKEKIKENGIKYLAVGRIGV